MTASPADMPFHATLLRIVPWRLLVGSLRNRTTTCESCHRRACMRNVKNPRRDNWAHGDTGDDDDPCRAVWEWCALAFGVFAVRDDEWCASRRCVKCLGAVVARAQRPRRERCSRRSAPTPSAAVFGAGVGRRRYVQHRHHHQLHHLHLHLRGHHHRFAAVELPPPELTAAGSSVKWAPPIAPLPRKMTNLPEHGATPAILLIPCLLAPAPRVKR